MLHKLIKIGLSVGLLFGSLNLYADVKADEYYENDPSILQKGDTVIVKKGSVLCYDKDSNRALDSFTKIDGSIAMMQTDVTIDGKKKVKNQVPNVGKISAEFCSIYPTDGTYKFNGYAKNDKYSLLDSKDYWIAVYTDSLEKVISKPEPKSSGPTYNFIGIDDLEAFPSDYIDKLSFIRCKKSTITEDEQNGGYTIMASCSNADGSYGFGSNNPFKIQIHINNKDTARSIAKSKNQEKWFLGTVKINPAQFAISKNIFEINEVQFK